MFFNSPFMSTLKLLGSGSDYWDFMHRNWNVYVTGSSSVWVMCLMSFYLYSTINDGFELPSRLSVSAADCLLSLTEALTKTPRVSTERQKSSNFKASDQHTTLISSATREKKGKPVHKSLELTNMEMEFLLWGHLQELISLVQRLLAVCYILVIF